MGVDEDGEDSNNTVHAGHHRPTFEALACR